jgi:hypothetical protein
MEAQAKFEGYAVVEIMGHNREVGFVTTEYFGGPALFRIDQPPLPEREYTLERAQWFGETLAQPGTVVKREAMPGKTAYVGPSAVFRLTPCDEATAREAIERMLPAPVKILKLVENKLISESSGRLGQDICVECNLALEDCQC